MKTKTNEQPTIENKRVQAKCLENYQKKKNQNPKNNNLKKICGVN